MVVLNPDAETPFGEAVPPATNYSITTNARGWDTAMRFRNGDPTLMARIKHIYPRFAPMRSARELIQAINAKLEMPDFYGGVLFTCPTSFELVRSYALHQKEVPVTPEDLLYRTIDINGIRLYLVAYHLSKTPAILAAWQNPGTGISIRFAETLIPHVDTLQLVSSDGENPPSTDYLPEGPSHAKLRERVTSLLHRAAIDPAKVTVKPDDVFLYNTGMAAIYRLHNLLLEYRPGTVVIVGVVFHNTLHHFEHSSPRGFKQFGPVDEDGMTLLESWLEEEKKAGRPVSYVFTEVPSNPLLASVDLKRLKRLSEAYDFVLVVDDTVGSFANIDVLPESDILVTSLTKSFSGYADVMAGSVTFNPLSRFYADLYGRMRATFVNEFYSGDADVLLKNSEDYLARQAVLNHNAEAMVNFLQQAAEDASSPVTKVLYPTVLPDVANYNVHLRRPTEDFPKPAYGCLFSVDFEDLDTAIAFYDKLGFYPGPHLGAHRTLMICFNALAYCKKEEEAAWHRSYGLLEETVRISAGLEKEEDLIDTLREALAVAKAKKEEKAAPSVAEKL